MKIYRNLNLIKFVTFLLLCFAYITPCSHAKQFDRNKAIKDIEKEIVKKEALHNKLNDIASSINEDYFLGSALNELDVREHSCLILAHILNKNEYTKKLKKKVVYDYNLHEKTDDNATSLRLAALSSENFSHNAKRILKLSEKEQIKEWNLDCISNELSIPKSAYIKETGQPTFYVFEKEYNTIRILGDIEEDFYKNIKKVIEKNPSADTIALGSGGGYVSEAIKAGIYIRSKGLNTTLWNNCYSACPLVFIGGVQRTIWSPYPTLGLHKVYLPSGEAVPHNDIVYKEIYSYLKKMGVSNPSYFIKEMWKASPSEINSLEAGEQLCEFHIATWVQRVCGGED